MPDTQIAALLRRLPDSPRWLMARGLCRSGRGRIVAARDGIGFVLEPGSGLACAFGEPGDAEFEALRRAATKPLEIHLSFAQAARLERALDGWRRVGIALHTHPAPGSLAPPSHEVRRVATPCDANALPSALAEELRAIDPWPAAAAAWHDGSAVACCYAFVESESLWDVAIDTLAPFRRRGFAAACASYLVAHQLRRRKRPVWGSEATNHASLALARRLGFEPAWQGVAMLEPQSSPGASSATG